MPGSRLSEPGGPVAGRHFPEDSVTRRGAGRVPAGAISQGPPRVEPASGIESLAKAPPEP